MSGKYYLYNTYSVGVGTMGGVWGSMGGVWVPSEVCGYHGVCQYHGRCVGTMGGVLRLEHCRLYPCPPGVLFTFVNRLLEIFRACIIFI